MTRSCGKLGKGKEEAHARVFLHAVEDSFCLEAGCFESGAGDVAALSVGG